MKDLLNCPNCGAPITGEKCQYCGAVFYDFASIDMDKPSYIKMRIHGKVLMFKAYMTSANINVSPCENIYADGRIVYSYKPQIDISIDFVGAEAITIRKEGEREK